MDGRRKKGGISSSTEPLQPRLWSEIRCGSASRLPGSAELERLSQRISNFISGPGGTFALLGIILGSVGVSLVTGWDRTFRVIVDVSTVTSFFLLFFLQRSQNKAMISVHVKLNELLAAVHRASPELINVETRSESEVREIHSRFEEISRRGPGAHSITDTLEPRPVVEEK